MDGRSPLAFRPTPARPVAGGPAHLRAQLRAREEYLKLAEAILASEEWRNARSGPAAARRRTLGRLVNRALVERGGLLEGGDRTARVGIHETG